jgi:S1-C subfamily serine protease
VGDFALALGSPLGLQQSATTGIISALNRSGTELTAEGPVTLRGMLQTSAPINPGNSGGALVNAQGELIGIPTLAAVDPTSGAAANGIGFAITSNHAQEVLKQFEK